MPILTNPIGVEQGLAYAIVGPDGTRAVFNDTADPDFVGFLTEPPSGLDRAGVRESADTIPEADGGSHGTFRYDRLSFTLRGIIPPDADNGGSWLNRQAVLRRATNAMKADARLLWTPSEGVPVEVSFRQQQPTRITDRRPKTFLVTGVSELSVVESQELVETTLLLAEGTEGGFTSPMTSELASAGSDLGTMLVTNEGDADAWPVITFEGPVSNPSLLSLRYGLELRLVYTLAAEEALVLDSDPRRRSVRLNGVTNRYSALDWPEWFPLAPDDNELRAGATSFSSGASVTVAHRHAWG